MASSVTSKLSVPAWALENHKRFQAVHNHKRNQVAAAARAGRPSPAIPAFSTSDNIILTESVGMAMLTKKPTDEPPPASVPQPAEFFRNIANHPHVLATILNTARHVAGYTPGDPRMSPMEKANAFQQFIRILDSYGAYLALTSLSTKHVPNPDPKDCTTLLDAVTQIIKAAIADGHQGVPDPLLDDLDAQIQGKLKLGAKYVAHANQSSEASFTSSFQLVGLQPKVGTNDDVDLNTHPSVSFSFAMVDMVVKDPKKALVTSEHVYVTTVTFHLLSSAIVAFAQTLAGSTITTVEDLLSTLDAQLSAAVCIEDP